MKPIDFKNEENEKTAFPTNKESVGAQIPETTKPNSDRYADVINSTDKHLIKVLTDKGPLTRNQLMHATKIARSTIYDSLLRLMLKKFVNKYSEKPQGPGRPKVFFQIRKDEPSNTPTPMLAYS